MNTKMLLSQGRRNNLNAEEVDKIGRKEVYVRGASNPLAR